MKSIKSITTTLITGLLTTGLFLSFTACNQQSPLTPEESYEQSATLFKKPLRTIDAVLAEDTTISSVNEQGSTDLFYNEYQDAYAGGKITLEQGSKFVVLYNSLTPPEALSGGSVILTMTCTTDQANQQQLFEFGPHGSTFEPAATVYFHYTGSNPKLYYIEEDGTYTEQQPDDVDTKNQWLIVTINHFSRYAVSWAE